MWFSKKPRGTSVALIDINSSGVGGGFVRLEEGKLPSLCYTVRIPFEKAGDDLMRPMLAALEAVGDRLMREGAPMLRSVTGDGSVDRVLVAIGSPWQEAKIESKALQEDAPFAFTKTLAKGLLEKGSPEERPSTQTIVATFLNGYATSAPFGKRASRAEIVVLSTALDAGAVGAIEERLHAFFHTREIIYAGFAEPVYRVLRDLYPHEKDFLLLSITAGTTLIASVKRGYLADVGALPCGAEDPAESWAAGLVKGLRDFAARHALPRTVFVLSEEPREVPFSEVLNSASLHALWLSDEPVSVIPIAASQFSASLKVAGLAEGDARLSILALYAANEGL